MRKTLINDIEDKKVTINDLRHELIVMGKQLIALQKLWDSISDKIDSTTDKVLLEESLLVGLKNQILSENKQATL